jgi:FMN-dependent NADH-azoreductase
MSDVLLINASPRRDASESLRIAEGLLEAMLASDPALVTDRLDLFENPPPAFGAGAALAKMDVIAGREVKAERQEEWKQALETAERLRAAELWVLAVPMWNSSLPWPLKQLIDTVTQPGVAFSFDPAAGYRGLLGGRRAVPIYTSQVYSPGVAPEFGVDHHSTYLAWWLEFVGVEQVGEIRLQPTFPDDSLPARREAALEEARVLGRRLANAREAVSA